MGCLVIDSLMPYAGENITACLGPELFVHGVLHMQSPTVVMIGEWRTPADKILAWRLVDE